MNDSNIEKSKSLFIIAAGIIIGIGRGCLNDANEENVIIIMGIINCIALGIVFLFLHFDVWKGCNKQIKNAGINTTIKDKCRNLLFLWYTICSVLFTIITVAYIIRGCTAKINDIISIIALAFSIASEGLSCLLQKLYYNAALKLAKKIK